MASVQGHGPVDCVTVHSMGGLGNQLFIYAAGLAAARAAGVPLRVDVSLHDERDDRPFLLEALGFPVTMVRVPARTRARRLRRLGRRASPPAGCSYQESPFRYEQHLYERRAGECMFGYFQCYGYVDSVRDVLELEFDRVAKTRLARHPAAVERLSDPSGIVLHVRRGDYLAAGAVDFHGLARLGYYRAAVDLLRRAGHDGPVFVFSDDVGGAMQELFDLAPRPAVDGDADAVDEMLLMSLAPALVTANSSFSWWAGWIGDREGRIVVSPRPWFDDPATDTRDLLPPHWLTLDRRVGV